MNVLIAASQRLFRDGLKCILAQHYGEKVAIHESSDDSAVGVCRELQPEIVLLDVDIEVGSGLELTARLVASPSRPRIVVVTSKTEPALLDLLVETGAAAYLTKDCANEDLLDAIASAMRGRTYVSEEFSRRVTLGKIEKSASAPLSDLSRREMEVMLLLAEGRSPGEIGNHLNVSPKTVASYKQRIHTKLNTRNTADITRVVVQSGLLTST